MAHVAQAPISAAQPSGVTVLPIQPAGSMGAGSSAQLQEAPESVSPSFTHVTTVTENHRGVSGLMLHGLPGARPLGPHGGAAFLCP